MNLSCVERVLAVLHTGETIAGRGHGTRDVCGWNGGSESSCVQHTAATDKAQCSIIKHRQRRKSWDYGKHIRVSVQAKVCIYIYISVCICSNLLVAILVKAEGVSKEERDQRFALNRSRDSFWDRSARETLTETLSELELELESEVLATQSCPTRPSMCSPSCTKSETRRFKSDTGSLPVPSVSYI